MITKSSAILSDKQDPSLVTELSLTYPLLYEHGFDAMVMYLEVIHLLFTAFYDKSLTPLQRVKNISIVKTILTLWREDLSKLKMRGRHFVTKQTFDDVICTLDGFILYIVLLPTKFPDADVVPWFLTSDACEQLFAFLRTGRYHGRRSNLDALTVLQGMSKKIALLRLTKRGFTC